jgi:hypothetical protein
VIVTETVEADPFKACAGIVPRMPRGEGYPARVQVPRPLPSKESSRSEPSAPKVALASEPFGAFSAFGA